MNDHVTIPMRQPNGRSSHIQVHYKPDGGVDLIFSRSSEGELLVMLPHHAVVSLREALALSRPHHCSGDEQ